MARPSESPLLNALRNLPVRDDQLVHGGDSDAERRRRPLSDISIVKQIDAASPKIGG